MEREVVLAAAVCSTVLLLALCADAALFTILLKAVRRGPLRRLNSIVRL